MTEKSLCQKQSEFKAGVINNLGLEAFIEDRKVIRERLRSLCSNCVILSPKKVQSEGFEWKKESLSEG